jgi:replicative DNA helicase
MIFSLEMSGISLFRRMLASVSEITLKSLRFGNIAKNEMNKLIESSEIINNLPIYIHDKSYITINDINSIAARYKRKIGLGLIIIDYVQLIKDSSNKEKRLEVAENSKFIKSMSKSLDVPIIVLSQLSRNCESRSDKRPIMSDLSESSSLEADADIVAFVHREYRYDKTAPENLAEFIIGKYRDGEIGTHYMQFDGDFQRFLALEENKEAEMKDKMSQRKGSKDKDFVF